MKLARIIAASFVILLLGGLRPARAEEITLKDGQKIIGTIVGYEKDMFRVETEYGIALVRKDKVASIQVTKPDSAVHAAPTARPAPEKPPQVEAAPEPAPVPAPIAAPAPIKPPPPPPPPVSRPIDVPLPAHLQEHVEGNAYFSDTFQFSMFKPPDWKIYEGMPKEIGVAIMAMGSEDEQTLLLVDRQVWSGIPKLSSDQVEAKLRQSYQDYHRVSEAAFTCDGQPATRRTFTGLMDGAEWHGVAVHVIHGNMVFGIIGLTSSENFQFQEAIFNKIMRTFHFIVDIPSQPANSR